MLGVPVMHNSYDKNNHSDEEEEDEEDSHEKYVCRMVLFEYELEH